MIVLMVLLRGFAVRSQLQGVLCAKSDAVSAVNSWRKHGKMRTEETILGPRATKEIDARLGARGSVNGRSDECEATSMWLSAWARQLQDSPHRF